MMELKHIYYAIATLSRFCKFVLKSIVEEPQNGRDQDPQREFVKLKEGR